MADHPVGPARANIETVAKLEAEFLGARTLAERIGDAIAGFACTMTFVILHVIILAGWFTLNSGWFAFVQPWDPYPFVLMAVIVSVEGVLLSTFILMKQNRMSRRVDERNHLNLQIDLLAEKEITKMLQMQRQICRHLGIDVQDPEVRELSRHTAVEDLAHELKEKLPAE